MTKLLACPAPDQLKRLMLGELNAADVEQLSGHILSCSACGQLLDSLQSASPLAADLRALKSVLPEVARADALVDCSGIISACTETHLRGGSTDRIELGKPSAGDESLEFLSPPQSAGEIGRLGDYRILEVLGSGGMGVVFRAEDIRLKRAVALKVMRRETAIKNAALERFLREAQLAAGLEHENIVTVHQVGEAGGVPFIAMQWLKGVSLEDYLRKAGRLSTAEVVRIGRQAARGLAAAHARGLIHRDIKPANLWLEDIESETGERVRRVKILDFGLARESESDLQLTQSGTIVGTLAYMAPEQACGEATDHRCDLFSLGVVLYRMTTGCLPFEAANALAMLSMLATTTPVAPHQLHTDIPPALSDLIMRLLEKDPAKRCGSAGEVMQALARLEERPATSAESQPRPKARRNGWLVAVAALFLFGGALAASTLIFQGEHGTLLVDVADEAEVTFKNGRLIIRDQKTGEEKYRVKPSERNKTLLPGKYLVEVQGADGLSVETDKFEITKNGKAEVRVTIVAPRKPSLDVSERAAAEWVLSVGGNVGVMRADGTNLAVLDGKLPIEPFVVWYVEIKPNTKIRDEDLSCFSRCARLRHVNLVGNGLNGSGLRHLRASAKSLDHLIFASQTDGGAPGSIDIADLQELVWLNLSGTSAVNDEVLKQVAKMSKLTSLDIGMCPVTDAGLKHLEALPQLKTVAVGSPRVTDEGIATLLRHHPDLNWLTISNFLGGQRTTVPLSHGRELQHLLLSGDQLTTEGAAALKKLPKLSRLAFHDPSDEGMTRLDLPNLKSLEYRWSYSAAPNFSQVGYRVLVKFEKLEALDFFGAAGSPDDASLAELAKLKQLKSLSLHFSEQFFPRQYTPEGVTAFRKARPEVKLTVDGKEEKGQLAFETPAFDRWVKDTAALPAERQVQEVSKKLVELNPQYDGKLLTPWHDSNPPVVQDGNVLELQIITDQVADLSPIRALSELKRLTCRQKQKTARRLDLSPLKGMKIGILGIVAENLDLSTVKGLGLPLTELACIGCEIDNLTPISGLQLHALTVSGNWEIKRLEPLKGMPLTYFSCDNSQVADLAPLSGMQLTQLACQVTEVADLSPLAKMPLESLYCHQTRITDLSPLAGMKLKTLSFTPSPQLKGLEAVRQMDSLVEIGTAGDKLLPPVEFWKKHDAGELRDELGFEKPGFALWVKDTAALPVERQLQEVSKKLVELNPQFDGKLSGNFWDEASLPIVRDGNVVELTMVAENVTDLSPIRALTELRKLQLQCRTKQATGRRLDLTPLHGMKIQTLTCSLVNLDFSTVKGLPLSELSCFGGGITNLTPISDMRLLGLVVAGNWDVTSLEPLKKMPLTVLACDNCQVADLSPLSGMRLTYLDCHVTKVADLSPLTKMPLETLYCHQTLVTDLSPLAGMKLKKLSFTPSLKLKGLEAVRQMDSLEEIGTAHDKLMPRDEFWKKNDAGEFTSP